MLRILIVDDNAFVRKTLCKIIGAEPDMEVSAEASSKDEALKNVRQFKPDVVLVDISLDGDESGLEFVREARRHRLEMPILVLSIHDSALYGDRAVEAGAQGYLMKQDAAEQLVPLIRDLASRTAA